MIKIASVETNRKIEAAADVAGLTYDQMMENAGRAIALRAKEITAEHTDPRVTILVGKGNNGGDGLVAGRILAQESDAQMRFYMMERRGESDANYKAVLDEGVFIAFAEDDFDQRVLRNMIASSDLLIDALFGIGIRLPIRGDAAKILRNVNQVLHQQLAGKQHEIIYKPSQSDELSVPITYVLAADCPSGLDCDTGEVDSNAIHAHETITFITAKPGLFTFPGASYVGDCSIAPIDIPHNLQALRDVQDILIDANYVHDRLPPRPLNANKGTFGKTLLIAGSDHYVGAAALSAHAAYRSGAGLVTVATCSTVVQALAGILKEPTWITLPDDMGVIADHALDILRERIVDYDALLVGPGLGQSQSLQRFIDHLLKLDPPPMIVDADGLNNLSKFSNWWERLPENTIITPHPGEMARLTGREIAEIQSNRWQIAREKAQEWNIIVLLKGAHTIIAYPNGNIAVSPFKSDALSTAGTGDVLSGIIVSLLGQGVEPFDAATLSVYLHGLAGEIVASELGSRSVIASDVIDALPQAIKRIS